MLPPRSTIGILGGGQLARMLALAAAQLGYDVHVFDPDPDCCGGRVAAKLTVAAFDDGAALAAFAAAVDVMTYEFENIDVDPIALIAAAAPIRPPLTALRIAQDRVAEKTFAASLGIRTAHWEPVTTTANLRNAVARIGTPSILKTTRFGYDGKGQAMIASTADAAEAWADIGEMPAILEARVSFDREFSILIARSSGGRTLIWDATENVHVAGILATSTAPPDAALSLQIAQAAEAAKRIANALDYVGVLAIEFFAGPDGPVFNEMAPRVHNSGHWTIEGAVTSQFENHIRAICSLPLGDTGMIGSRVSMENLIGDRINDWPRLVAEPGNHVHIYGKGEARPGRKMGHVTRLA